MLLRTAEGWAQRYADGSYPAGLERLRTQAEPLWAWAVRSGDDLRWRAALALSPLWTTVGREAWASRTLVQVQREAESAGEHEVSAAAWAARGRMRLRRGQFEDIIRESDLVDRWSARVNASSIHIQLRIVSAHAEAWTGSTEKAHALLQEAVEIGRGDSEHFGRGLALGQLAHLATHDGDEPAFRESIGRALSFAQDLGAPRLLALVHWAAGWGEAHFGRAKRALIHFEVAAATQAQLGEWAPALSTTARIVALYTSTGETAKADQTLRQAAPLLRQAAFSGAAADLHAAAHGLALRLGHGEAAQHRVRALRELAGLGVPSAFEHLTQIDDPLILTGAAGPRSLIVALDGTWLHDGVRRVDLTRRKVLQRVLSMLAQALDAHPGAIVDASELASAVWPTGGSANLHSAVWGLRRLGLSSALEFAEGGYRLSPRRVRLAH